ncbi:MAG: site-specific DNA-methyltransferase [Anaerolineae bacterium]|nr:site-specific DNA-methyltransferase [Anaerolineae bacterium]
MPSDLLTHLHLPRSTRTHVLTVEGQRVTRFIGEFWTAKQRQAHRLHEIAYRACFKPQLPRLFIESLTTPNDLVYDPFSGRGTTIIEAARLGRNIIANDINPLSHILSQPRLCVPDLDALAERLAHIPIDEHARAEIDLSMFYHPRTLAEIVSLRRYLLERRARGTEDHLDAWIRMVATNRLTGHSSGFFSVYTLPPNQAVSPERQRLINAQRKQVPPYRDTRTLILKKSRQLVRGLTPQDVTNLARAAMGARFLTCDARHTSAIASESVQLTVTSPPFLDVVQYAQDNWLRCWFNDIDARAVAEKITQTRNVDEWAAVMQAVFHELYRITRRGGWVAFEVGEVRRGEIELDARVVPLGTRAGFVCRGILINQQKFTKTANIWGIRNNVRGTNTNRVVVFQKP